MYIQQHTHSIKIVKLFSLMFRRWKLLPDKKNTYNCCCMHSGNKKALSISHTLSLLWSFFIIITYNDGNRKLWWDEFCCSDFIVNTGADSLIPLRLYIFFLIFGMDISVVVVIISTISDYGKKIQVYGWLVPFTAFCCSYIFYFHLYFQFQFQQ